MTRSVKIEDIIAKFSLDKKPELAEEIRSLRFPAPAPDCNSIMEAFPKASKEIVVNIGTAIGVKSVEDPKEAVEMVYTMLNGENPVTKKPMSQDEIISVVCMVAVGNCAMIANMRSKLQEMEQALLLLATEKIKDVKMGADTMLMSILKGEVPIDEEDFKDAPDDAILRMVELSKEITNHYEAAETLQYSIETEQRNKFHDRFAMVMKEARDRGLVN